jgi:CubicO group peptidase (beta-lactamase class C family)
VRTISVVAVACCLLASGCSQDAEVVFDDRFSEVRELIREQVSEDGVPSIAVAVAEDGEIVWEEAFGWSDVENRVRATPHIMYRLGSITKTITATGLMLLVEEGSVDLDGPAVDYLPQDVRPRAFEGEVEEVTVRHLLNHRAGMPAYAESFFEDDEEVPRPLAETVRRYGIIAYPPGWSFIYCNLGYQMVASMIAQVSGMSYAEFIEERVFAALGMTHSRVNRGLPLDQPYAACYTQDLERIPPYRTGYPGGDGNYASAHDLIRFAMFHLGDRLSDQKAILTNQSLAAMQEAYPPSNQRYGIGWDLDANDGGYRSVYHGGEGPGVDAFMRLFPTEDIAAVVLCNAECEKLYEIQKAIFIALIPELGEPEPVEPEIVETSSTGEASDEPNELYGTWKGRIIAYDRELDVELLVDGTGAKVGVGDQPEDEVEIAVLTPTFLLGMFDAEIPTPDNQRFPYRNRLAVVADGDRLFGAVISVGRREGRAGHYELSSRIELRRSTPR